MPAGSAPGHAGRRSARRRLECAATIVGDLSSGEGLPADTFDCVICTQTLHVIWDFRAAIRNLQRMLKPGGVLLDDRPGHHPCL